MTYEQPGWVLCIPCQYVRHDACEGDRVWCECFTELLIEAEELSDDEGQR